MLTTAFAREDATVWRKSFSPPSNSSLCFLSPSFLFLCLHNSSRPAGRHLRDRPQLETRPSRRGQHLPHPLLPAFSVLLSSSLSDALLSGFIFPHHFTPVHHRCHLQHHRYLLHKSSSNPPHTDIPGHHYDISTCSVDAKRGADQDATKGLVEECYAILDTGQ